MSKKNNFKALSINANPWPLPYFSVKAVNYSTGTEWLADSSFIGVSRPRNIVFNYIVRAA
ncbi:hypothetical protein ACSLVK_21755 [Photorhabdus tasmaniensis]|uniref:hypothetical protein n=1 Tax=Photorhabdus tasmaniensis TaxID=1004159 RepID=UPI004042C977